MADIVEERLSHIDAWQAPAFQALIDTLLAERSPIYVVGGNVRDFLLGRNEEITDLDIVLEKPVQAVARRVADTLGWAYFPLDRERDVARLVQTENGEARLECDLAGLRGNLADDLSSRDFTVNSLALRLAPEAPPRLIDVCNGVADLRERRLRLAAEINLDRDPLRMLRAVRLAYKLGLEIEPDLRTQIHKRAPAIQEASLERIRDELWKMLALSRPGEVVEKLHDLDLLRYVLPELADTIAVEQSPPHHLDVYAHTLLVMDYTAQLREWLSSDEADGLQRSEGRLDPQLTEMLSTWREELRQHFAEPLNSGHTRAQWLVWHALFHDMGKPATRTEESSDTGEIRYRFFDHEAIGAEMAETRLADLRFSRKELELAKCVVAAHMRPHHLHASFRGKEIRRRAAYRFFRDTANGITGERTGVDVLLLALADRQGTGAERGEGWPAYLAHIEQLLDFAFRPLPGASEPLLDGEKLIATFNLEPGPLIGRLLAQIHEAQAVGDITCAAEAMALAAQVLDQHLTDEPESPYQVEPLNGQ